MNKAFFLLFFSFVFNAHISSANSPSRKCLFEMKMVLQQDDDVMERPNYQRKIGPQRDLELPFVTLRNRSSDMAKYNDVQVLDILQQKRVSLPPKKCESPTTGPSDLTFDIYSVAGDIVYGRACSSLETTSQLLVFDTLTGKARIIADGYGAKEMMYTQKYLYRRGRFPNETTVHDPITAKPIRTFFSKHYFGGSSSPCIYDYSSGHIYLPQYPDLYAVLFERKTTDLRCRSYSFMKAAKVDDIFKLRKDEELELYQDLDPDIVLRSSTSELVPSFGNDLNGDLVVSYKQLNHVTAKGDNILVDIPPEIDFGQIHYYQGKPRASLYPDGWRVGTTDRFIFTFSRHGGNDPLIVATCVLE